MNNEINEDLRRWFKEKWVDISKKDASGKHPPCGRSESKKKGYPKCRPSKRVSSETPETSGEMSPKEKEAATRQKRSAEKKTRKGKKPHMTSHHNLDEQIINEGKNIPTDPKLWSRAKSLAKKKFKVYPSAYANGWAAKWYKKHGGGWKKESQVNEGMSDMAKAIAIGSAIAGSTIVGAKASGVGRFAPQTQTPQVQAHQEEIPVANVIKQPKEEKKTQEPKVEEPKLHHETIQQMVKQDEGLRLRCYKCTAGKTTVGYGHNMDASGSSKTFEKAFGKNAPSLRSHLQSGGSLTREQADALFDADYDEHVSRAKKFIPNLESHPPQVQAALVSGTYRGHIGDSPKFRKLFNSGDYHGAAKEFLNRGEYTKPARKSDGSLLAPGVITRLERDHKILSDYAHSKNPK